MINKEGKPSFNSSTCISWWMKMLSNKQKTWTEEQFGRMMLVGSTILELEALRNSQMVC
jgi:hypothetical protein